jgi:outer membrane receptor protein involved in Fe transport
VGRRRDLDPVSGARFDAAGRAFINEGYAKLNLSGSYRINRGLRAFARIENLLNQDYQEVLGFPAYRLNFSAGLRVQIGGDK